MERKQLINRKILQQPTKHKKANLSLMKKVPPKLDYSVGSCLFYSSESTYCKVVQLDEKGIYLDIAINNNNYVSKDWSSANLKPVSEYHIGIIKKYFSRIEITTLLLQKRVELSVRIIRSSDFSWRNLEAMKSLLVPEPFTEIQW
jgi:hypothetical protein